MAKNLDKNKHTVRSFDVDTFSEDQTILKILVDGEKVQISK